MLQKGPQTSWPGIGSNSSFALYDRLWLLHPLERIPPSRGQQISGSDNDALSDNDSMLALACFAAVAPVEQRAFPFQRVVGTR